MPMATAESADYDDYKLYIPIYIYISKVSSFFNTFLKVPKGDKEPQLGSSNLPGANIMAMHMKHESSVT